MNQPSLKKVISLIYTGATWEECAKYFHRSVSTLQRNMREHYKYPACYKRLLKIASENKKRQAEETLAKPLRRKVIVVETGYLLELPDIRELLAEGLDIYIPLFCINELKKLSSIHSKAAEVLKIYWEDHQITSISLKGRETLYVDPTYPVKNRSKGIVALCTELHSLDYDVEVRTNSQEVVNIAMLQSCGLEILKI